MSEKERVTIQVPIEMLSAIDLARLSSRGVMDASRSEIMVRWMFAGWAAEQRRLDGEG